MALRQPLEIRPAITDSHGNGYLFGTSLLIVPPK